MSLVTTFEFGTGLRIKYNRSRARGPVGMVLIDDDERIVGAADGARVDVLFHDWSGWQSGHLMIGGGNFIWFFVDGEEYGKPVDRRYDCLRKPK